MSYPCLPALHSQTNTSIKREIVDITKSKQAINKHVIILDDFNSHLGYLSPQPLNKNGELVLELIEEVDLTILNGSP